MASHRPDEIVRASLRSVAILGCGNSANCDQLAELRLEPVGLSSERTITIREARVPDKQNRRAEQALALHDRKGNLVMAERTRSRLAAIEAFAGSAGGMNEARQPE